MEDKTGAKDVSYDTVVKNLIKTERGAYSNLNYEPVFRASALFHVECNSALNTRVTFLNYWHLKNDNTSVGLLVSLRDNAGQLLYREHSILTDHVYDLSIEELLGTRGPFLGTLEVEFFSSHDLKFQFPAVTVIYESAKGLSFVHTNQRVYNNISDEQRNSPFDPCQSGFDVSWGKQGDQFPVLFINSGPVAQPALDADLQLFNEAGRRRDFTLRLAEMSPYATERVELNDPEMKAFMQGQCGFAKLRLNLEGVSQRFAVGVESNDHQWLGITHTYYDCINHDDYYSVSEISGKDIPAFVPINLVDNVDVVAVFYPILSPSTIKFELDLFDASGDFAQTLELDEQLVSPSETSVKINVNEVLVQAGIEAEAVMCNLRLIPIGDQLPARIKFGLNYHSGDKLGTNICSSVLMAPSHGIKYRTWQWGCCPIRPGASNLILLSHMSREKENSATAEVKVTLYGQKGPVATASLELDNRMGTNVCVEDIIDEGSESMLWYVIESANSSLITNQIHISSSAHIGGDHSF